MKRVPSFCKRPGFPAGLRVLLVANARALGDDDLAASQELLSAASYEVTVAKDASKAPELLHGDAVYDIALVEASDFFASTDSGKALRDAAEELTVVLLTRAVEPVVILKAIKAGAMDVMAVPMAPRSVDRLWQYCVRKRMAVTAERALAERFNERARAAAAATNNKTGPAGATRGGGASIPLHGSAGGARGPSWSSLPPPPMAAPAVADASPQHSDGAGGTTGRVTRPRTRPGGAAARPAPLARWATPAPPGVKHVSWGRQPPLAPQPLAGGAEEASVVPPERPSSALSLPPPLAPPPLPAWCLGPLGDVDMDMDDTDVLSPFDDMEESPASTASLLPLAAAAQRRPAPAHRDEQPQQQQPQQPSPPQPQQPPQQPPQPQQAPLLAPLALAGGSAPAVSSIGCYTSLQAQLASLEQEVALEASRAAAGLPKATSMMTLPTCGAGSSDGGASPTGSAVSETAASATGALSGGCGPLGLKLRKSESLVNLVASTLGATAGADAAAPAWHVAA